MKRIIKVKSKPVKNTKEPVSKSDSHANVLRSKNKLLGDPGGIIGVDTPLYNGKMPDFPMSPANPTAITFRGLRVFLQSTGDPLRDVRCTQAFGERIAEMFNFERFTG